MTIKHEIKCVGDYLKIVKDLYPENEISYFRGHASINYHLNSSLCRVLDKTYNRHLSNSFCKHLTNTLFNEFKTNMPAFSEIQLLKSYDLNDLDLIMVAQHYGLSTRLIDWTKNPLVALYFATENVHQTDDCCVFVLRDINIKSKNIYTYSSNEFMNEIERSKDSIRKIKLTLDKIQNGDADASTSLLVHPIASPLFKKSNSLKPNIDLLPPNCMEEITHFGLLEPTNIEKARQTLKSIEAHDRNIEDPINSIQIYNDAYFIIESLPLNQRIKNQQGVFAFTNKIDEAFTITSDNSEHIKDFMNKQNDNQFNASIVELVIPRKFANHIHKELNMYGLTQDFIYPELQSYTINMQTRVINKLTKELSIKI